MAEVWYVKYADELGIIDPTTVYNAVLAGIQTEDPTAYIKEVRQYPYQIAFLVVHPESITAGGEKKLSAALIIAVAIVIAFALRAVAPIINAWTNYVKETRKYTDVDPTTGMPVEIKGYSAYLTWLKVHYPGAAEYLETYEASPWWEPVLKPIVWVIALVIGVTGLAIVAPTIMKGIAKARAIRRGK